MKWVSHKNDQKDVARTITAIERLVLKHCAFPTLSWLGTVATTAGEMGRIKAISLLIISNSFQTISLKQWAGKSGRI